MLIWIFILIGIVKALPLTPVNFEVITLSSECLGLSWQPTTDSDISHEVSCVNSLWAEVSTEKKVCNFAPYTSVTCSLRARSSGVSGEPPPPQPHPVENIPHETSPAKVLYNAAFTTSNTPGTPEDISLEIDWDESQPFCSSLSYYKLTITQNSNDVFHQQFHVNDQREITLDGIFTAYTGYEITMLAFNSQNNQSELSVKLLTTPQLPSSDGPGIHMNFYSCVSLTFSPPSTPNGYILYYRYACDYTANVDLSTLQLTQFTDTSEPQVSFCPGLESMKKYTCAAAAVNSAGAGEVSTTTEYTPVTHHVESRYVLYIRPYSMGLVRVYFYSPIPYYAEHVEIRNYLIVVSQPNGTSCWNTTAVSFAVAADNSSLCYIAAVISPNKLSASLDIGADNYYGEYYNAPLVKDKEYEFYVVMLVYSKLEEEEIMQYIAVKSGVVKDVPCPRPPEGNNSIVIVTHTGNFLGDTVTYGCEDGFILRGNDKLRCQLNGTESIWFGKLPKCRPVWEIPLGVGLPLSVLAAVLLILGAVKLNKVFQNRKATDSRVTPDTRIDSLELEVDQNGGGSHQSTSRPRSARVGRKRKTKKQEVDDEEGNQTEPTRESRSDSEGSNSSLPRAAGGYAVPSAPELSTKEEVTPPTRRAQPVARNEPPPPSYHEVMRLNNWEK
ncbi:hypothetical protein EB796_002173 [Bugula neritina]|uniref:Sushi domain-containing protein n=1 Tax=Bugula neritina TaxID=10212 RepID=A0A7J7KMW4_BUGNE|nr:hypothetical protein EB796_002173 [Bugula neritina]